VRELTGGVGADVVVDIAGTLARSIAATRDGGQVSAVGIFAGVRTEIDLIPLIRGNLRVHGILTGSRAMLEELVTAMVTRNLRPVIHHTYEFDQAPDAYRAIASREGYVGKLVIRGA
jgi:NADPH:quinone reductase-like Zn-dependent oxidoreductase